MNTFRVYLSYVGRGERFWGELTARSERDAAQTARRLAQQNGQRVTAARAERIER